MDVQPNLTLKRMRGDHGYDKREVLNTHLERFSFHLFVSPLQQRRGRPSIR